MKKKKISLIIIWIYLWMVSSLQTILTDRRLSALTFIALGIVCGIAAFVIFLFLSRKWDRVKYFMTAEGKEKTENCKKLGIEAAICTFAIFMIYFAGQYPGGMGYDIYIQYAQAAGDIGYNNWHPVLHTFLFFTLPVKAGGKLGLIVFMQLLYFSLAFGYLVYALSKNGCREKFIGVMCCFIWLNPYMATYMVWPWKDTALTIFATLLMGYYIQIIGSAGKWFEKTSNVIIFSAAIVCCTFMRHNAILFTAPLLAICICRSLISRKIKFKIIACIVLAFCMVKVLYVCLDVEKPGNRIVETVGLPATIWCNVMKENPDSLPEKTSKQLEKFATREEYKKYYITGSFNSIKFTKAFEFDSDKIEDLSYYEIAKITLQCFEYAPKESIEALVKLTGLVWAVTGEDNTEVVRVDPNDWEIKHNPNKRAESIVNILTRFADYKIVNIVCGSLGFIIITLISLSVIAFSKGSTSFVHALPLLIYDYGTMLLLSGKEYRYFLLSLPLWLPVIYMILHDANLDR